MSRLFAGLLIAGLVLVLTLPAQSQQPAAKPQEPAKPQQPGPRPGLVPALLVPADEAPKAALPAGADAALPAGALARLGTPQTGTFGAIYSVAFAPDGKTLVSGGSDKRVRLWDVAAGKELRELAKMASPVYSVSFAPDGRAVAAASVASDTIVVCEPGTGKELVEIAPALGRSNLLKAVAYSPDGTLLAMAGGNMMIRLREAATGKEVRSFGGPRGTINAIAFSPNGKALATVSHDCVIRVWDVATGAERHTIPETRNVANCVAFSPDGTMLATGGADGNVRLWDVPRETNLFQIPAHRDGVHSLAFSPDGKTLATGGRDHVVRLWEVATGKERRAFAGSPGLIHSVAFSPDGRTLASGNHGDTTVLLWDVTGLRVNGRWPGLQLPAREVEALWADLGSHEAARGYRAVWRLMAAPAQAVPLLRERLRPQPKVDKAMVDRLIADLDSNRFPVREKAQQELEKLGRTAEPALQRVLNEQPSLEVRRRVEELLEKLSGWVRAPDRLQTIRGVEVLEHIATPEARDALEKLSKQTEDGTLAQNADESLKRLARPPAARQ